MKKKLPKIAIYIFLTIFLLQIISIVFLLFIPSPTSAADIKFTPQIGIPNDPNFGPGKTFNFSKSNSTKPIADYIIAIYKYGIGIVGIIATVVMMIGGVIWLTAGGSPEKIKDAQEWIKSALTGLVLALGSYLILATINTDLVNFKIRGIQTVKENTQASASLGCCEYVELTSSKKAANMTKTDCEKKSGTFAAGKVAYQNTSCQDATAETTLGCCQYAKTALGTTNSVMSNKAACSSAGGTFYVNRIVYEKDYQTKLCLDSSNITSQQSASAKGCCIAKDGSKCISNNAIQSDCESAGNRFLTAGEGYGSRSCNSITLICD